jgi:microcystin degradation protein MlrC
MKLVIARISHETNTFSPLKTPISSFSPAWDAQAKVAAGGSATAMGAFLDFAKARDAIVATPVFATAYPSGIVCDDAFEQMANAVVLAVQGGCDGILLDLHGAMVTESYDDGEGELLDRLRRLAPGAPIGVALDLHANISQRLVANADIVIGFRTYPHVDMYETGERVARLFARLLDGEAHVHNTFCHIPLLASTLCMDTRTPGAMKRALDTAREMERKDEILAVSVFGGFPLADIPDAGMSVVVVSESVPVGKAAAKTIAREIWAARASLIYEEEPLTTSIQRALSLPFSKGPVLLLDHGDNCMSGGTCDTMHVLKKALEMGTTSVLAGPIADPQAVALMATAGIGGQVSLSIGNRWDSNYSPLQLDGVVRSLGDGNYTISGPTYTGMRCAMGKTGVFETKEATILVSEKPHEPWDLGIFSTNGLDPSEFRFILLKSRMYCRPVFEAITQATIECASPGVTSSNLSNFSFKKLGKQTYPLENFEWLASAWTND